jgi:hypothetical protein
MNSDTEKNAWTGTLNTMYKKGVSEAGISAATFERDFFDSDSHEPKLNYLETLIQDVLDPLLGSSDQATNIDSVPSFDLLSKIVWQPLQGTSR